MKTFLSLLAFVMWIGFCCAADPEPQLKSGQLYWICGSNVICPPGVKVIGPAVRLHLFFSREDTKGTIVDCSTVEFFMDGKKVTTEDQKDVASIIQWYSWNFPVDAKVYGPIFTNITKVELIQAPGDEAAKVRKRHVAFLDEWKDGAKREGASFDWSSLYMKHYPESKVRPGIPTCPDGKCPILPSKRID